LAVGLLRFFVTCKIARGRADRAKSLRRACRGEPGRAKRLEPAQDRGRFNELSIYVFERAASLGAVKKIEAIVKPFKTEPVKEALMAAGVEGMTLSEVKGFGRQKGHSEIYRGTEYTVDFLPKIKFEMVVPDDRAQRAIEAILRAAKTGKIGDGKIFVAQVEEAVRIRTDERGMEAL
jgi:nitrogen regulatory protein PII